MHKILIHSIKVQKVGAKLQFQIRLPKPNHKLDFGDLDESIGVKGLLITHTPLNERASIENGLPRQTVFPKEVGWIWLRVPEERNVFYTEAIKESSHNRKINPFETTGFSQNGNWWIDGTMHDYLKIDVLTNRTVIEGFYIDRTKEKTTNYEIRIYLKIKLR